MSTETHRLPNFSNATVRHIESKNKPGNAATFPCETAKKLLVITDAQPAPIWGFARE